MATVNLGRVKPIYKGDYSASSVYKPLDFVKYNGLAYFCILQTTAGIAPSNATYWALVADAYTQTQVDSLLSGKVSKVTSTDNAIARFDGTTGSVQNSGISVTDNNHLRIPSSGGGSVEIAAPSTANNYTLTAPASTGTILNDGSALSATNLTGNVDVARLVSAFSGSNVSLGTNGYQKLPSGLIIQWGRTTAGVSGTTVTLPISFPNAHVAAFATTGAGAGGSTLYVSTVTVMALSSLLVTSGAAGNTVYWLAIGY